MGVSFISAITVLGYPGHAYVYGTIIFWFGLASSLQLIFACAYYIPLLYRLRLSSVYEVKNKTIRIYKLQLSYYEERCVLSDQWPVDKTFAAEKVNSASTPGRVKPKSKKSKILCFPA